MPLCGFAASTGSVRASTRMASAPSALVHQYLLPVINQSSPSRSARVERPEMSDPVPGSAMEKAKIISPAAIFGRYLRFCSGVMARSEEHTSELQSLMRISYALFCLKKKRHYLYIHIEI